MERSNKISWSVDLTRPRYCYQSNKMILPWLPKYGDFDRFLMAKSPLFWVNSQMFQTVVPYITVKICQNKEMEKRTWTMSQFVDSQSTLLHPSQVYVLVDTQKSCKNNVQRLASSILIIWATYITVSINGVTPMDGLFHEASQSKMHDLGVPRWLMKPPYMLAISRDWLYPNVPTVAYLCNNTIMIPYNF